MARRSKASFEKRAREKKKAEKAALKRENRAARGDDPERGAPDVATADDLEGYGLATDEPSEEEEEPAPPGRDRPADSRVIRSRFFRS